MDLTDGQVVLTIPASFDDIARNLTAEAAEAAGLGKVVLLEEPLAAFYAWTAQAGKDWRALVRPGDIVLVCDVGGGTADFSLIAISEKDGALDLNRISVGEHILLGGDNMDLALAYALRAKLEADGKSISDMQFLSLTHSAGKAKVAMLEDESMTEFPIAVPTRGSSLLGKTVSTKLDRQTLEQIVLDGFFVTTSIDDLPQKTRRAGLQEFGVPIANVIRLASDGELGDPVARCGMLANCCGRCSSGCSDRGRHSKPRTWPCVSRSLSCSAPRRRGSASMPSIG